MRNLMLIVLSSAITLGCGKATSTATSHQRAASTAPARETEMSFDAMKAAAENGDPRAQSALGYAYDVGQGVTQDLEAAAHWYRKAAEQGYANAQFNLAEMTRDGAGVPQSNEEALKWYTRAGMQGHSKAQYNIAMMHVKGEGVPANNVTAYAWLVLSATGDAEGADQARDIVGKGIGDKIVEGNALAAKLQAEISKKSE